MSSQDFTSIMDERESYEETIIVKNLIYRINNGD